MIALKYKGHFNTLNLLNMNIKSNLFKISVFVLLFALLIFGATLNIGEARSNNTPFQVIVLLEDGAVSEEARDAIEARGGKFLSELKLVDGMVVVLPNEASVSRFEALDFVKLVEEDTIAQPLSEQKIDWGVERISAPEAWATSTGKGVKVGILDTGIQLDHPDLNVVRGVDCTKGPSCDRGGDGDDDRGHGTHVAGIVAALDNEIGTVGVAHGADLYSIKVLTRTGGRYSDVIKGIEWSIENEMQVINMSLGATTYSTALENAVNAAYNAGILSIAAAGNNGDWEKVDPVYPAAYNTVMAIGAVEKTEDDVRIADFSNWTSGVDLVAPGVKIMSTWINSSYREAAGTSMAAPHVAGVAALVWSVAPELTNQEVWDLLREKAECLGYDSDKQGSGLVNAAVVVEGFDPYQEENGEKDPEYPEEGELSIIKFEVKDTSNPVWTKAEVTWAVQGNELETVELKMFDEDDREMDSRTISVSGFEAEGVDELRSREGGNYVVITVYDKDGETSDGKSF